MSITYLKLYIKHLRTIGFKLLLITAPFPFQGDRKGTPLPRYDRHPHFLEQETKCAPWFGRGVPLRSPWRGGAYTGSLLGRRAGRGTAGDHKGPPNPTPPPSPLRVIDEVSQKPTCERCRGGGVASLLCRD